MNFTQNENLSVVLKCKCRCRGLSLAKSNFDRYLFSLAILNKKNKKIKN
jgi:hypothetical protein